MTETEQVTLAGRVDAATWGRLCADDRFLDALASDDVDYAKVVMQILDGEWAPSPLAAIPIQ
jgi:hypothetical protein